MYNILFKLVLMDNKNEFQSINSLCHFVSIELVDEWDSHICRQLAGHPVFHILQILNDK